MRETWEECVIVELQQPRRSDRVGPGARSPSPYRLLASSVRISLWNGA